MQKITINMFATNVCMKGSSEIASFSRFSLSLLCMNFSHTHKHGICLLKDKDIKRHHACILQIIIWEKKVSWFDDEDVYVAWFREISWKRNCVQNNKSMYYIRDYLFHISVRYEKELVLILTYFMHRNSDDKYCEKHCEINFSHISV